MHMCVYRQTDNTQTHLLKNTMLHLPQHGKTSAVFKIIADTKDDVDVQVNIVL